MQNAEATSFLARIEQLPVGTGADLDAALRPSLDDEAELRKLFAQDKGNDRLKDPHVGLVDVFDASPAIRTTRARVVVSEEDLGAKHIMSLSEDQRRKEGTPAMVQSLDDFKKNWAIFTENSLSQLTDCVRDSLRMRKHSNLILSHARSRAPVMGNHLPDLVNTV